MKRIISFVLTLVLLLSVCVITTSAVEGNATDINAIPPSSLHWQMHDGSVPVDTSNPTAQSIAFRATITGTWYGIAYNVGHYDRSEGSEITVSVYAWNESYTKTLEGNALAVGVISDKSGAGYTADSTVTFETPLEAGDYVVVAKGNQGGNWNIGLWGSTVATVGVDVWVNGVAMNGVGVCAKVYVDAPAGKGINNIPPEAADYETLADPYAAASGKVSWPHAGTQWTNPSNMLINGKDIGTRVVLDKAITNYTFDLGVSGTANFIFKMFKWNTDYATTVASTPVAAYNVLNAQNSQWVNIPFEGGLEAGEYLAVISSVYGGGEIRMFTQKPDTSKAVSSYVNGVEDTSFVPFIWIYGSELGAISPKVKLIPAEPDHLTAPAGAGISLYGKYAQNVTDITGKTYAIQLASKGKLHGICIFGFTTDSTADAGYKVTTYKWNTDYATTVAGEAIDVTRIHFGVKNSNKYYVKYDTALDEGNYLIVIDNAYTSSGYTYLLSNPNKAVGLDTALYIDGEYQANSCLTAIAYISGVDKTEAIPALPETIKVEGHQLSDVVDGKYNIRFVATGNEIHAAATGFIVKTNVEGKEWNESTDVVYQSINAKGSAGLKEISAKDDYNALYLSTMTINGVDAAANVTFTVTPYIVSLTGTIVYGETVTITPSVQ